MIVKIIQNKRRLLHAIGKIAEYSVVKILTAILILSYLSLISLNAQSPFDRVISLKKQNVPLKEILIDIELQANVDFTYSPSRVSVDQRVTIQFINTPLQVVLDSLLPPLAISYKLFNDRTFVLSPGERSTRVVAPFIATGTIQDESGYPLIGASVTVKDGNVGTITDEEGNFSLICPKGSTLVVSYIGFIAKEVVAKDDLILITLQQGLELESITIIGSRGKQRTDVDRPVPIDVITAKNLYATGQQDIGQSLHYTAPSFNSIKFGINDLAPLVDPASLRGLAPDQTLLLVNGKEKT